MKVKFKFAKYILVGLFVTLTVTSIMIVFLKIDSQVKGSCQVVALRPQSVKTEVDGFIDRILIETGQYVKKDEVLLELDGQILEEKLNKQTILLDQAKKALNQAVLDYENTLIQSQNIIDDKEDKIKDIQEKIRLKKEDIRNLQLETKNELGLQTKNLNESQNILDQWLYDQSIKLNQLTEKINITSERLNKLEEELSIQRQLYDLGLIAKMDLISKEMENTRQKNDLQALREEKRYLEGDLNEKECNLLREMVTYNQRKLVQLEEYYKYELAKSSSALDRLQLTLEEQIQDLEGYVEDQNENQKIMQKGISYAKEQLEIEKLKKAEMESDISKLIIKAPISGFITSKSIHTMKGAYYQKSDELLKIVEPDNLVVEIYVDEENISRVKGKGEQSHVKLNSYPHTEYGVFEGQVIRIMPTVLEKFVQEGKNIKLVKQFVVLTSLTDVMPVMQQKNTSLEPVRLIPGMEGEANIIVEQNVPLYRYLYNLLIKKLI